MAPKKKKTVPFILNFLVLPGLGNILLGRKQEGSIQVALTLLAIAIIIIGKIKGFELIKEFEKTGAILNPMEPLSVLALMLGGFLFALAVFIWVAVTYTKILKNGQD